MRWRCTGGMRIDVLTIFPDLFTGFLSTSIPAIAIEQGRISCHVHDIRAHAANKHRKVDDRPAVTFPSETAVSSAVSKVGQAVG